MRSKFYIIFALNNPQRCNYVGRQIIFEKETGFGIMSASQQNDASSYIPEAGLLSVAKHFLSFTRKAGLLEVWTVGLFSFVIFAVSQLAKSDPTQFFPSSLSSRPSQVYIPGISDVSVTFPLFVLNFLISLALITRRLRTLTWSLWWLLPVVVVPYYSTLFVALLFFLPTTAELKSSSLLNLISNNNSSDNVDTRIVSPDIGEEISEKENNTKVVKKTNNTNAAQSTLSDKSTNEPQVKIDPPIVEIQEECLEIYKGQSIFEIPGGYATLGSWFKSIEKAKRYIDKNPNLHE